MKYVQNTFTLPSAPPSVCQKDWDLSVLSSEEFKEKYGQTPSDYIDGKRPE